MRGNRTSAGVGVTAGGSIERGGGTNDGTCITWSTPDVVRTSHGGERARHEVVRATYAGAVDSTISFGKVYIIEWLGPDDAKTGWDLYGELEPMGIMSRPPFAAEFKSVATRDEFIAHLRRIQEDLRATEARPLLHIETHGITTTPEGGPHGIGASGNEYVLWPELMQELISLNRLTQLRLFVVLAACEGVWGMKMLIPTERAAFLVLLGPVERIKPEPLAKAMQTFYRTLFQQHNGNAAFNAMNAVVDRAEPAFWMINAEMAFRWVCGEYFRTRCTPAELARRAESILHGIRWKHFIDHGRPMPLQAFTLIKAETQRYVENHHEYFVPMRRGYFFIDVFPDNDKRFPITLADCLAENG